jgi:hypothetical protein
MDSFPMTTCTLSGNSMFLGSTSTIREHRMIVVLWNSAAVALFPRRENNISLTVWRLIELPSSWYINSGIHTIWNMHCLFVLQNSWSGYCVSLLSSLSCLSVLHPSWSNVKPSPRSTPRRSIRSPHSHTSQARHIAIRPQQEHGLVEVCSLNASPAKHAPG